MCYGIQFALLSHNLRLRLWLHSHIISLRSVYFTAVFFCSVFLCPDQIFVVLCYPLSVSEIQIPFSISIMFHALSTLPPLTCSYRTAHEQLP